LTVPVYVYRRQDASTFEFEQPITVRVELHAAVGAAVHPQQPRAQLGIELVVPGRVQRVGDVEPAPVERELVTLAGSSDDDPVQERRLAAAFTARRVDGLIVVPAGHDHAYLLRERARLGCRSSSSTARRACSKPTPS
jgi:hypothetical protein